jgi:hypothetical protein
MSKWNALKGLSKGNSLVEGWLSESAAWKLVELAESLLFPGGAQERFCRMWDSRALALDVG